MPPTTMESLTAECGTEVERAVEEAMEELAAALHREPEVQEIQEEEVEKTETLGAKTKVDALESPKKRRAKKLKVEAAGIETSNPFEVLGDVGVEVESPA